MSKKRDVTDLDECRIKIELLLKEYNCEMVLDKGVVQHLIYEKRDDKLHYGLYFTETVENKFMDSFTNWMPLPQPPKGE